MTGIVTEGWPLTPANLNALGSASGFAVTADAYGAVGDGTTDDSAAIQSAIDAAGAAGGGTVFLPAGTYALGTGLSILSGSVTLAGAGRLASVLKPTSAMSAVITVGSTSTPVYDWGLSNMGVSDVSSNASYGAYFAYGREGIAQNVWLKNGLTDTAIYFYGSGNDGNWSNRFHQVAVTNTAGDGVYLGPASNADIFEGCDFSSCGGSSVVVGSASGCKFVGCELEAAGSGYEVAIRGTISGCRALGLTFDGCYSELSNATTARFLKVDESGGNSTSVQWVSLTDTYIWGGQTARYLIESSTVTGSCLGLVVGCGLHGATHAAVMNTNTADRISVIGVRGLTGFGTGSTLTMIDNNTGTGSGTFLQVGSKEWHVEGALRIGSTLDHEGSGLGFFNATPTTKPTVTGSKGANAALTSLLSALSTLGLVTDSSS